VPHHGGSAADLAAQAVAEGLWSGVAVDGPAVLDADRDPPWRYRSWIFPRDHGSASGVAGAACTNRTWTARTADDEYVRHSDEKPGIQVLSRVHPGCRPAPPAGPADSSTGAGGTWRPGCHHCTGRLMAAASPPRTRARSPRCCQSWRRDLTRPARRVFCRRYGPRRNWLAAARMRRRRPNAVLVPCRCTLVAKHVEFGSCHRPQGAQPADFAAGRLAARCWPSRTAPRPRHAVHLDVSTSPPEPVRAASRLPAPACPADRIRADGQPARLHRTSLARSSQRPFARALPQRAGVGVRFHGKYAYSPRPARRAGTAAMPSSATPATLAPGRAITAPAPALPRHYLPSLPAIRPPRTPSVKVACRRLLTSTAVFRLKRDGRGSYRRSLSVDITSGEPYP